VHHALILAALGFLDQARVEKMRRSPRPAGVDMPTR
jgi:hypothetical protein